MNNKECTRSHPKRCFKFCDFGAKHQKGCKMGKKCQYWHPRICKYSMKDTVCPDEQCTFQHLVFTRKGSDQTLIGPHRERETYRRDREDRENRRDTYRHPAVPKLSLASSAYNTPYAPTINKPPKPEQKQERKHTEEQSFLLKLMENLRAGFQEQIEVLRKEVRERDHPWHQPIQQQGHRDPMNRVMPGPPLQPFPYQYPMAQQWYNQSFPPLSS